MNRVAVVGAGTMGNGIAHVFAQSGWDTVLIDVSDDAIARGLGTIKKNLERQVKKGAVSGAQCAGILDRITTNTSLAAVRSRQSSVCARSGEPALGRPNCRLKAADLSNLTSTSLDT